jgi:hypothetical protein
MVLATSWEVISLRTRGFKLLSMTWRTPFISPCVEGSEMLLTRLMLCKSVTVLIDDGSGTAGASTRPLLSSTWAAFVTEPPSRHSP